MDNLYSRTLPHISAYPLHQRGELMSYARPSRPIITLAPRKVDVPLRILLSSDPLSAYSLVSCNHTPCIPTCDRASLRGMSNSSCPRPPALGTFIDNGALQLVSILGYGGYGVVYRAIDTRSLSSDPPSFAVKCLIQAHMRNSSRQRRLHLQEINLHQLASVHPHVVTLHRVIEEDGCTFIVMDYCPDGDLFSQILHKRRYLGHDGLIKHVFLQLLDAVEFCHSRGIYHRDLKPENVLCFGGGLRLAITDFGLATTERVSEEFRTGSVYHMSPGTSSIFFLDMWQL
jgi:serine/threonine protein kinase